MKSFKTFLTESASPDFIDLPTAIQRAKADGYIVTGAKGSLLDVRLDQVPHAAQTGPDANYRYIKGDLVSDSAQIIFYEIIVKKTNRVDFKSRDGKKWLEVEVWHLPHKDYKEEDPDAEWKAEYAKKAPIMDKKIKEWIKRVFDKVQKELEKGRTLYYTTMTHQFPASKPEHIKLGKDGELYGLRSYGPPMKYDHIGREQVCQLAQQVGMNPNEYWKIFEN